MKNNLLFQIGSSSQLSFIWALVVLVCIAIGIVTEYYFIALFPFVLLAGFVVLQDISWIYYTFFLLLPFSIEVYLPNGLGTDLPSEPLMWVMFVIFLILLIGKRWQKSVLEKYNTPITWALIAHLVWITFCVITASDAMRSSKYLLAKLWYVLPFYFLSLYIFMDSKAIIKVFKYTLVTLIMAMSYVFINHAFEGFSFKSSNDVVQPIFRNHVNYASMLVLFLPYVVLLRSLSNRSKFLYSIFILFFITCIYFSYTRAAILSIFIGIGAYYIIQFKLVKKVIIAAVTLTTLGLGYLSINNNYLEFAPNFEKTITHNKFDNLIEATYKMEDISTMERLYRWVAGFEMVKDRPFNGFGPNNFYVNYSKYTISAFQTYVSDNPDQSGIHNYYLMTAVDQGIIGLLIFLVLIFISLILGQNIYHKLKNEIDRKILMATLCSLVIILSLNLINDMLETDKVGPFFFLSLGIISFYYYKVSMNNNTDVQQ